MGMEVWLFSEFREWAGIPANQAASNERWSS